ncbi:uncharacterized protein NEMAJ01_2248 [Nematocida major]|uniref:uncharacterized protein n=1 Tax=Nematocida major TaxID=1912982 RepID=UPI002007F6C2|nr:uncharacterized protein NEMAJ01_2248 [Nematocida major]KAH9387352.1 hypothetical protein NEMAJ01_2248 [Nematocida major]
MRISGFTGVLLYGGVVLSTEAVTPPKGAITPFSPGNSGVTPTEGPFARVESRAVKLQERVGLYSKSGEFQDEKDAKSMQEQVQTFLSNVRNFDNLFKQGIADILSLKKDQTSKWNLVSRTLQSGFTGRLIGRGHKFDSSNLSPQEKKESLEYTNFLNTLKRIISLTESTKTVFQKVGEYCKEEMPKNAFFIRQSISSLLNKEYILGILENIGAGKSQPDCFKNVLSEPKSVYSEIILETFNLQKMLNKKFTPAESVLQADAIFETLLDTFLVHEYRIIQEVYKKDSSPAKMEYLSPIWKVLIQEINTLEDHAIIHKEGREKVVSRIMNCLDALSRHMLKIHPVLSGIIDPTSEKKGISTLSLLEDQTLGNLEMNSPDLDEVAIGKWLGIRGDASYMEGIASSVSKKTGSALETITSRLPRLFWDNSAAWEKSLLEGIPASLADKKREDLKSLEVVLKNSVKILQVLSNYLVQEYTVVSQTPVLASYENEPNSSLDKAKEAIEILQGFPTFACYLEKANFLRRENTPGRIFCPEFMRLAVNEVQQFQMFVNRKTINPMYISFLMQKTMSTSIIEHLLCTAVYLCEDAAESLNFLPKTGKKEEFLSLKGELEKMKDAVESLSPRSSVNMSALSKDVISSLKTLEIGLEKITVIDGFDLFYRSMWNIRNFHSIVCLLQMHSSDPSLFTPYAEIKVGERLESISNSCTKADLAIRDLDEQADKLEKTLDEMLSKVVPTAPPLEICDASSEEDPSPGSENKSPLRNPDRRWLPVLEIEESSDTDFSPSKKELKGKAIFVFCGIAVAVGGTLGFFLWRMKRKTRGVFFK